jgi:hypothetical protein
MRWIVPILLFLVCFLIVLYKDFFKKKVIETKKNQEIVFELGSLKRPLYILFAVLSSILFLISIFVVVGTISISFYNYKVPGEIRSKTCSVTTASKDYECYRYLYSYVIAYKLFNMEYSTVFTPQGIRFKDSTLATKNPDVGDKVNILVNKLDYKDSIIEDDIFDRWVYTLSFFFIGVVLQVIGIYRLKKVW